jgi:hypothetical protein
MKNDYLLIELITFTIFIDPLRELVTSFWLTLVYSIAEWTFNLANNRINKWRQVVLGVAYYRFIRKNPIILLGLMNT